MSQDKPGSGPNIAGEERRDAQIHIPGPVTVVHRVKRRMREATWYGRVLYGVAGLFAALAVFVLLSSLIFRVVAPPTSSLMLWRSVSDGPVYRTWVDLDQVSPQLVRAVVLSEDARFCQHWGVDWAAVETALETAKKSKNGTPRGASTISMQSAKNMYLWSSRSYLRKAIEVPLAYWLDLVWQKRRTLEIYLNIAEWGPGIFGIEQAAWAYFDKPARRLNARESALLATALPNPTVRSPRRPRAGHRRLADRLMGRMKAERGAATCVLPRKAVKRG